MQQKSKQCFLRSVYECASACSSQMFCSAFQFDATSQVCQLVEKDKLGPSASLSTPSAIPVYINPNQEILGNNLSFTK